MVLLMLELEMIPQLMGEMLGSCNKGRKKARKANESLSGLVEMFI
jgi:hypothetical protein